jgi:hypothetical protein
MKLNLATCAQRFPDRGGHAANGDWMPGRMVQRRRGDSAPSKLSGDYNCTVSGWSEPLWVSNLEDRDDRYTETIGDVHRSAIVADEYIAATDRSHELAQRRAHYDAFYRPIARVLLIGSEKDDVCPADGDFELTYQLLKLFARPALSGM